MVSQDQRSESLALNGDRSLAAWEIVSVITSCLIAEWVIIALAGEASWLGIIPIFLAVGLMLLSHKQRNETARDVGFRFDNFLAAGRLLILPTLIAMALIVLGSWLASGPEFSLRPTRPRLFLVPIWALFQQYALQGFINRRAQIVFGPGLKSSMVVALLFSLVHLPSPLLGILALVGGFVWASIYQRQPNLFALAISHAATSLTLSLTIPANVSDTLRIGFKYFGLHV